MSATVLHQQAIADIKLDAIKRVQKGSAAATTMPTQRPMFETNLTKTQGIHKFLVYAMEDLRLQVEHAASTSRTRREFDEVKAGAQVLAAWISGNMALVEGMLQSVPKKEDSCANS